jgi:NAD(P)-dependent dehydrogenase (short-subunit alcohol dehydrogenase family)
MSAVARDGLRTYDAAACLVTGGSSGIGAALARSLAVRGARVVVADRDLEGATAEAERICAAGGRASAVPLDVRDATAVEQVVAGVFDAQGRLDYLFNNAGIAMGASIHELSLEDWQDVVAVNLMGPIHGLQAAYPRMLRQGFGHIVNTASMAAFLATPMAAPYGTTKSALVGLSRALRTEAARFGVRVSVLCPGVVRTPILSGGTYGRLRLPFTEAYLAAQWERARPMHPDVFAGRALSAVARNRGIIVIPGWWEVLRLLNSVAPALCDRLVARELRRLLPAARPASDSDQTSPPGAA